MKTGTTARRGLKAALAATTSAMILAMASTAAHALPGRDDISPNDNIDTGNTFAGVGMMLADPGFVCTGQLINARTVVYAAHCSDTYLNEQYGSNFGGFGMAWGFNVSTRDELLDWFFSIDRNSNPADGVYNVLQVQTVIDADQFDFPGADVALATLDTPAIGLPTYGMLFSPITETTAVNLVGYGTTGDGTRGAVDGIDWQRRIGTNMLDGLFSQDDFIAATFALAGGEWAGFFSQGGSQLLYNIDFDKPDRIEDDCGRGTVYIGPNDYTCATPPYTGPITWDFTSVFDGGENINWYGGDATDRESGTAGGDSGSGLFVEIDGRQLVTGVLSGGWTFTSPNGGYGDVSYYNPLFLYQNWIIENNPYVYASAVEGDGNWSDASHWQQDMDPNYLVVDSEGNLVNGTLETAPDNLEDALTSQDGRWGQILDRPVETITGNATPPTALSGGSAPTSGVSSDNNRGDVTGSISAKSNSLVQDGLGAAAGNLLAAQSGIIQIDGNSAVAYSGNLAVVDGNSDVAYTTDLTVVDGNSDVAYTSDITVVDGNSDIAAIDNVDGASDIPEASFAGFTINGDGTLNALPAGWVPNNDWGTYGTWTGPTSGTVARFYDVMLGNAGTTTVDMNVELDMFGIANEEARLVIPEAYTFNTLIAFNHTLGIVELDGLVNAREYMFTSGVLTGNGELNTTTLWNVAGGLAPGRLGTIGDFTLTGDYVQTAGGSLWIDIGPNGTSDTVTINGDASFDGMLLISPVAGYTPRYGDTFQFATVTGNAVGTFAGVTDLTGVLTPTVNFGLGTAEIELEAVSFASQANFSNDFQIRLGLALDAARDTDYAALSNEYGVLDLLEGEELENAFTTMAPVEAIMFDRGVRSNNTVLTRALRGQIGLGGSAPSGGEGLLAELKQSEGRMAGSAIGQLSRLGSVRDGHAGGSEHGLRAFATGGIIAGETLLTDPNSRGDISGSFGLIGLDAALTSEFRVGFAAGFAESENDGGQGVFAPSSADVTSTNLSLFGTYNANRIFASAAVTFSDHELDSTRVISLGSGSSPATADYGADGIIYDFLVAYDLTPDATDVALSPFFSVTGSEIDFEAGTNSGAVGGLNIAARTQESLVTRYGINVDINAGEQNSVSAYAAIASEHEDDNDTYAATFTAAPTVGFAGTTTLDQEDWAEFGASWSHTFNMGGTLSVSAEALSGNEALVANTVAVEFSLPF